MKTRLGFVSNSSCSSFIAFTHDKLPLRAGATLSSAATRAVLPGHFGVHRWLSPGGDWGCVRLHEVTPELVDEARLVAAIVSKRCPDCLRVSADAQRPRPRLFLCGACRARRSDAAQESGAEQLPSLVLCLVLEHIDRGMYKALVAASGVCRAWRATVVSSDALWCTAVHRLSWITPQPPLALPADAALTGVRTWRELLYALCTESALLGRSDLFPLTEYPLDSAIGRCRLAQLSRDSEFLERRRTRRARRAARLVEEYAGGTAACGFMSNEADEMTTVVRGKFKAVVWSSMEEADGGEEKEEEEGKEDEEEEEEEEEGAVIGIDDLMDHLSDASNSDASASDEVGSP
eukprot:m51a1_g13752 hypothetical protein (348) ;mRNA; f:207475-208813